MHARIKYGHDGGENFETLTICEWRGGANHLLNQIYAVRLRSQCRNDSNEVIELSLDSQAAREPAYIIGSRAFTPVIMNVDKLLIEQA